MPAYRKCRPVRDEVFRRTWSATRDFCEACGIPHYAAPWPGLSTHHIVKFRRSDEPTNLLRLCDRDHRLAEGLSVRENGVLLPTLSQGACLNIKRLRSPNEYDAERLEQLLGRPLPELEDIPLFLFVDWSRWRPFQPMEFNP